MRLSRTSFFTDRRGNASGDAARARRRSPSVLMVEIDGMPDSIPARIARCIRRFVRRGPSCSRTAAAARSARKTRSPRSIADSRPAPTAWSSTCTSPATALSSSITTPCSIARRAHRGPLNRSYGRRARRIRCAAAPSRARALPEDRHHHRAEGTGPAARRGGCRRGAPRRRERSRVPGIVQRHRAARGARGRARDRDERRAIRSADGAVSIVVRPVTRPRAVSGVSGSRNERHHARRLAPIRAARAQSRHCRAGVDGGRARRHSTAAGLGSGRHHFGQAGCGGRRW